MSTASELDDKVQYSALTHKPAPPPETAGRVNVCVCLVCVTIAMLSQHVYAALLYQIHLWIVSCMVLHCWYIQGAKISNNIQL